MTLRQWISAILLLPTLFAVLAGPAKAVVIERIAVTGEAAPGLPSPVVFDGFLSMQLSDSGYVAFGAELLGPGIFNQEGIWLVDPSGEIHLVARERGPTPGLPDGTELNNLRDPLLNEVGQVAFPATISPPSGSGVFIRDPSGDLRLEIGPGDPVSEPAGAVLRSLFPLGLTDRGDLGLTGELEAGPGGVPNGSTYGAWGPDGDGGLVEIVRQRSPAPDLPDGTLFSRAIPRPPRMNARGEFGFVASLERGTGDVDTSNNSALFGPGPDGGPVVVARRGGPAPGGPSGSRFHSFVSTSPALDEQGRVAFRGSMEEAGEVTRFDDDGIWGPDGDGGITLLARESMPAPGAPPGVTFAQGLGSPALAGGRIGFTAQLFVEGQFSSERGVFGPGPDGRPVLRFMTGDILPGARGEIDQLNNAPRLGLSGQLAVLVSLFVGSNNAILYANPDGETGIVVQQDQLLEFRPGVLRAVKDLRIGPRLTKSGQLLFRATFTDGSSGLFRATLPSVLLEPEIDVRPRSERNRISPMGRRAVRVAVLGSETFDVGEIDVATLAFGPAGAAPRGRGGRLLDVNHDGFTDLVSRYRIRETGIAFGDTEACVSGETFAGEPFEGCDEIRTLPGCRWGAGPELAFLLPALLLSHRRSARSCGRRFGSAGRQRASA